jgi:hypothetical protein
LICKDVPCVKVGEGIGREWEDLFAVSKERAVVVSEGEIEEL